MIITIMNMQNKLYRTQFSHHPMTNLQPVPEQRSWTTCIFTNFTKFSKKTKLLEKFELLDKRRFEILEKKPIASCPPNQPPFIN